MTIQEFKRWVAQVVIDKQGCKASDLCADEGLIEAGKHVDATDPGPHYPVELFEDMVKEGLLVEVEYVLPSMPYRAKSFFLPAGTEVNVNGVGGKKA